MKTIATTFALSPLLALVAFLPQRRVEEKAPPKFEELVAQAGEAWKNKNYGRCVNALQQGLQMAMKEHEAILDAIEEENPRKATKCIEKHLDRFLVDIPQFCKQHPDYFVHDLDMESEFAKRTLS